VVVVCFVTAVSHFLTMFACRTTIQSVTRSAACSGARAFSTMNQDAVPLFGGFAVFKNDVRLRLDPVRPRITTKKSAATDKNYQYVTNGYMAITLTQNTAGGDRSDQKYGTLWLKPADVGHLLDMGEEDCVKITRQQVKEGTDETISEKLLEFQGHQNGLRISLQQSDKENPARNGSFTIDLDMGEHNALNTIFKFAIPRMCAFDLLFQRGAKVAHSGNDSPASES
jgi:hypothetical protein